MSATERHRIAPKEAILKAREYVKDLFAGEILHHLGLEEIEFDDTFDRWRVTIGFRRSWDPMRDVILHLPEEGRVYKVVEMAEDGSFISIKNREVEE